MLTDAAVLAINMLRQDPLPVVLQEAALFVREAARLNCVHHREWLLISGVTVLLLSAFQ